MIEDEQMNHTVFEYIIGIGSQYLMESVQQMLLKNVFLLFSYVKMEHCEDSRPSEVVQT